jgi:hypothetical protein
MEVVQKRVIGVDARSGCGRPCMFFSLCDRRWMLSVRRSIRDARCEGQRSSTYALGLVIRACSWMQESIKVSGCSTHVVTSVWGSKSDQNANAL